MKKVFIALLISGAAQAQQQWRFHIAFEDATGARDTIWLLYDTTAHVSFPTDTALGEGRVILDYNAFNVWIYNYDIDSTKTVAFPYAFYPFHGAQVHAFNYVYPIIVRWDTSLFHASYLPYSQGIFTTARIDNDYFFLQNNDNPLQGYNMFIDDTAYAPWFWWGTQSHFPMSFTLTYDPNLVGETNYDRKDLVYPNPISRNSALSMKAGFKELRIYTIDGKAVFNTTKWNQECIESILQLSDGVYFLVIMNLNNQPVYDKIIKTN